MATFFSINPATGAVIKEFNAMAQSEVNQTITHNHEIYHAWRKITLDERIKFVKKLSDLLNSKHEEYATIITIEMGKLFSEAKGEVKKCAKLCDFYAQNANKFLSDELITTEHLKSYVSYQPLGIVLGVMPWNFPFWQVFRYAIPALLAGNTVLLKHASNVPQCGILLENIFKEAGVEGFSNLIITSEMVSSVITNNYVKAITLTGSNKAGEAVAQLAGSQTKKTVLELGGSDPYIILKDADLNLAIEKCVESRMLNAGQSCIAAKRFIIEQSIFDDFVEGFRNKLTQYVPNDPFDDAANLAPLATENIRKHLHEQVQQSIKLGAHCIIGGDNIDHSGFYYAPTILTNITPNMPAYDEELFGPVASMIKVKNENEAIKVANNNPFGLGGAIFSKDIQKAEKLAREELQSGSCFVNDYVKSDPRLPFGGINSSGYGRELSHHGILEFTNIKTVCVN
ncbi:MAG: NAD-dependent succinate-semialdehyde dehydrogenase [Candidatus Berkiella sp.]